MTYLASAKTSGKRGFSHRLHDDVGVHGERREWGVDSRMIQQKPLGDWNPESGCESWRRHVLRVLPKPAALSLY